MRQLATIKRAEDWFDHDALYAAKHLLPKNERLYYIKIADFLALALKTRNAEGSDKKRARLNDLVKTQTQFSQIPYLRLKNHLKVDPDDLSIKVLDNVARVWGHEGRHRSMTLRSLGFTRIPVIVKFQEMTKIPEYVVNQNGNRRYKFSEIFKPFK